MFYRLLCVGALCGAVVIGVACGSDPEELAAQAPRVAPSPEDTADLETVDLLAAAPPKAAVRRPRVAIDSLAASAPAFAPGVSVSARQAMDTALSPDGTRVVTLRAPDADGGSWQVVTWDLETGEEKSAIGLPDDETPTEVAFRRDGQRLAVSMDFLDVVVIDVPEGRILGRVGSEEDAFQRAVFTADGRLLVGGTEEAVEAWDAESFERVAQRPSGSPFDAIGIPLCVMGDPPDGADHCARVKNREGFLSPAGRFYVQASEAVAKDDPFRLVGRQAHLYEPEGLAVRCRVNLDQDAEVSPDAFAAGDGLFAFVVNLFDGPEFSVFVIDTATCKPPKGAGAAGVPAMVSARFVVVNAATMMALVVGDAYTAELWKPTSQFPPRVGRFGSLDTEHSELLGAAFSQQGERVGLFGFDGKLQTFETSRGARLSVVQVAADGEKLRRVTFLPDGRRALVAIQRTGSAAALVDTDTGRVLRRFQ